MGRGDMGFDGAYSLRAIDSWIAVINSNLEGTNRIAYKGSHLKLRGGVTEVLRAPQGSLSGIQIPETALIADQTSIDFSQGSIIQSPELAHCAIQGYGFFLLNDLSTAAGTFYYTRDGEFHLNSNFNLVNDYGLFVLASTGAAVLVSTGSITSYNPATGLGCNAAVYITWAVAGNGINVQGLQFSKYGSTIFLEGTSNIDTAGTPPAGATVTNQSLETSNTALSSTLPELSLAQKMFTAVSKIISVHQNDLDTVVNLIR